MAGGHAALFEIALVILLRAIERAGGSNFGRYGPVEFLAGFQSNLGLVGDRFLFRRMGENRGTILLAKIGALAVHLRGIVHMPEGVDQRFVTDLGRVEGYLHDFGVASLV